MKHHEIMSAQDIEDKIWSEDAEKAHAEGYLDEEKRAALLNRILPAEDKALKTG